MLFQSLDDIIELIIYSSVYILGGIIFGRIIDNLYPKFNQNITTTRLVLEIITQGAMDIVLSYLIRQFTFEYLPVYIPIIDFDKLDTFGSRRSGGVIFAFAIISGQTNLKNKVNELTKRIFGEK